MCTQLYMQAVICARSRMCTHTVEKGWLPCPCFGRSCNTRVRVWPMVQWFNGSRPRVDVRGRPMRVVHTHTHHTHTHTPHLHVRVHTHLYCTPHHKDTNNHILATQTTECVSMYVCARCDFLAGTLLKSGSLPPEIGSPILRGSLLGNHIVEITPSPHRGALRSSTVLG